MPTPPLDEKTVLAVDPWLEKQVPHILHRHSLFRKWKDTIDEIEGGYDKFTKGYLKFGLNVAEDGTVTYREWAPNAKEAVLIGEFSASSNVPSYRRCALTVTPRQLEPDIAPNDQGQVWRVGDHHTSEGWQVCYPARLQDQGKLPETRTVARSHMLYCSGRFP